MGGNLHFLLRLVQTLLRHGRYLADTPTTRAAGPKFPVIAAAYGTHDLARIAAHLERGIRRAIALQRYLLARAAKGRDIPAIEPAGTARAMLAEESLAKWAAEEAAEAARAAEQDAMVVAALNGPPLAPPETRLPGLPKRRRADPDDSYSFRIPTVEELEREVRRGSISRVIADICLDLGLTPSLCEGGFWNDVLEAIRWFGDAFGPIFDAWQRRKEAFEIERSKRPGPFGTGWLSPTKDMVCQALGCLIGEPPPTCGPPLAIAPS